MERFKGIVDQDDLTQCGDLFDLGFCVYKEDGVINPPKGSKVVTRMPLAVIEEKYEGDYKKFMRDKALKDLPARRYILKRVIDRYLSEE